MPSIRNAATFPLIATVTVALLCCAAEVRGLHSSANIPIVLNSSLGTWEGFGVSLCWWARVFHEHVNVTQAAFSLDHAVVVTTSSGSRWVLPGLGLAIARYNAGASSSAPLRDGARMSPSPNIPWWKQMQTAWVDNTTTNASRFAWNGTDEGQLSVLFAAVRSWGVSNVEVFSNSPVWWQLKNLNPSGADDGLSDNLRDDQFGNHCLYLAAVASWLATAHDIPVVSLELFNEPSAPWWHADGTQEGCHFSADTQASVLALLPEAMRAANLSAVRVSASDESYVDWALATWQAFSSQTRKTVQQVNVHGYQHGGNRTGLYQAVVVESQKILRNSEYGDGDGSGLTLLESFFLDWALLHPTAWCYWQVVDVAPGWGLLLGDADDKTITTVNTKYYVVAQLSRHLRPGDAVIPVSDPYHWSAASVSLRTTGPNRVSVVTANFNSSAARNVTFPITAPAEWPVNRVGDVRAWVTEFGSSVPNPSAAYHDFMGATAKKVSLTQLVLQLTVPPRTVVSVDITWA